MWLNGHTTEKKICEKLPPFYFRHPPKPPKPGPDLEIVSYEFKSKSGKSKDPVNIKSEKNKVTVFAK